MHNEQHTDSPIVRSPITISDGTPQNMDDQQSDPEPEIEEDTETILPFNRSLLKKNLVKNYFTYGVNKDSNFRITNIKLLSKLHCIHCTCK